MKKLGIVIIDGVGFRNFKLLNFIEEVLPQFDAVSIYSGFPKSAYQNRLTSYSAIKEQ